MKRAGIVVLLVLISLPICLFALKPEKGYRVTPDSMHIAYKQLRLIADDGAEINTWMYEPKKDIDKKMVLIMSAGDAGNMGYMIYQAYNLSQKGFRVITYDYRGFGKSSDFAVNEDFLYYDEYVTDLQTVINYSDLNFKDHKIVLYGFSMGSIISGYAAAKNPNVSGYIADGYVASPTGLLARLNAEPAKAGETKREFILPYNAGAYDSIIKSLKIPFLIFAGLKDTHTSVQDATVAVQQQDRRALVIYDGVHGEAFLKLTNGNQKGDLYFNYIAAFGDGISH